MESRNKIKNGTMERGATIAPVMEAKSGNEVNGRLINAAAHKNSLSKSSDNLRLTGALDRLIFYGAIIVEITVLYL